MQRWLMVMFALGASSLACSGDDASSNGKGGGGQAGSSGGSAGATGGTGTGGGSGGAGQAGGPTDGGDACTQCKQTQCATEIQACEADAPCKAARACLAACAPDDGACKVDCLDPAKLPVGNAPFTNMSTCFGDKCSTECM